MPFTFTDQDMGFLTFGITTLNPTDHENDRVGRRIGFIHERVAAPILGAVFAVDVNDTNGAFLNPLPVDVSGDAVLNGPTPGRFFNGVEWCRAMDGPGAVPTPVTSMYWSFHVTPGAGVLTDLIGIKRADIDAGVVTFLGPLEFEPEPATRWPMPAGSNRRYIVSVSYADRDLITDRLLLYYRVDIEAEDVIAGLGNYKTPVWWCQDLGPGVRINDLNPAVHEIPDVFTPPSPRSFMFRMVPDTYAMVFARNPAGTSDLEIVWKDVGRSGPDSEVVLMRYPNFVTPTGPTLIGVGCCYAPALAGGIAGDPYVVYATFAGTLPSDGVTPGSWFDSFLVHYDHQCPTPYSKAVRDATSTAWAGSLILGASQSTEFRVDADHPFAFITDDEFYTDGDGMPYVVLAMGPANTPNTQDTQFRVVSAFVDISVVPALDEPISNTYGAALDPRDGEPLLLPRRPTLRFPGGRTSVYFRMKEVPPGGGPAVYHFHRGELEEVP